MAAILWVVSAAAYGVMSWNSVLPHQFVAHVTPATIPAHVWHWPPLWATLAVLGSAAVVFLAYLWCVSLAAESGQTRRTRFFVFWFAAIIAGFIATAPWALAQIGAGFPLARLGFLLDPAADSMLKSGYWGILWGWLPAFCALRFSRSADAASETVAEQHTTTSSSASASAPTRAGRGGWWIPALLIVAVLGSATVYFVGSQAARLQGAQEEAIAEGRDLGEAPDPSVPVNPPPSVAPNSGTADPSWCTPEQAMVLLSDGDAATGHRVQTIRVMNFGETACALDGYPDLAFADASGSAIDVTIGQGDSFMATDAGAQPITLEPGGYAKASIGWNAMATDGELATYKLFAAMYPGLERGSWPVELDIVAGGEVAVTAWELAEAIPGSN